MQASDDRLGRKWVLVLVTIVAIVGLACSKADVDDAKIGDCLAATNAKRGDLYKVAECSDPGAKFRVYDHKASRAECIDVPGTSRSYHRVTKGSVTALCIGDKDVDLAKAINGIHEGECVVARSDSAERAACGASESRPVLKVLKDVRKMSVDATSGKNEMNPNACISEGAKGTRLTYGWGIEDVGPNALPTFTWDRVLCLGDKAR